MRLTITDDFDLRAMAESGQCFRWTPEGENGWRILHGARCLYIRPLGEHAFEAECAPEEWCAVWHGYFDLDTDYAALRARIDPADEALTRAADFGKGRERSGSTAGAKLIGLSPRRNRWKRWDWTASWTAAWATGPGMCWRRLRPCGAAG
ncbi:MAG: hypothetical protein IKP40_00940 [Clostridia bacterium]|nr:hypothetical protein [Clostridia bacterium]